MVGSCANQFDRHSGRFQTLSPLTPSLEEPNSSQQERNLIPGSSIAANARKLPIYNIKKGVTLGKLVPGEFEFGVSVKECRLHFANAASGLCRLTEQVLCLLQISQIQMK